LAPLFLLNWTSSSTDNCEIESFQLDKTTFDCTHIGENTVTLTITDVNGKDASAISRIPCVINTKIATKVFKDNDLVEVDADKGIVKLLKRS